MRILWVVTKPPWPMRDGGRVLVAQTLEALAADGHELVLVAPFDPRREQREEIAARLGRFCEPRLVAVTPRSLVAAAVSARRRGRPVSIERHSSEPVRRAVAHALAERRPDVVHAEQVQALAQCDPADALPVVLRSQNVETDLWSGLAASRPWLRAIARWESARMARYEGQALRAAAARVALTARDAERLRALSGAPLTVHHVPAPFPTALPAAGERLDGAPAVVVLGGGWLPNRDGAAWFASAVWPHVRARCPGAVLHLFGSAPRRRGRGIVRHPSPVDSAAAFAPGAILAVPLRIASGVRIKILEAWARGVPVVATPEAAAGLEATDGVELLIARDPAGFAAAIHRLDADPAFARASVDAGRARLGAHHDPRRIAGRLVDVYTDVAGRRRRVGIDAG